MFKNMKLSQRISFGFISILLIAVLLGIVAIFNMMRGGSNAKRLDDEYVPVVLFVEQVKTSVNKVKIDAISFSLSEKDSYYELAQKEEENTHKILDDFASFAKDSANAKDLEESVAEVHKAFVEYQELIDQTKASNDALKSEVANMIKNGTVFLETANSYLESQKNDLTEAVKQNKGNLEYTNRINKINNINKIIIACYNIRLTVSAAIRDKDILQLDQAISLFPEIETKLNELKLITVQNTNMEYLSKLSEAAGNYKKGIVEYKRLREVRMGVEETRVKKSDEVIGLADKMSGSSLKNTQSIATLTESSLGASTVIMIIGLAIAVILGITLSIAIISSITKSINRIVNNLKTGAEQVYQASEQLSSASQSLAEGSSEQASAIEETSSTLDETSSMVQQNTENTKQAAVLSNSAKETADKGNREMEDMMVAMSEIKASSNQISKIIKVIDDIAFQTNILALNAAVEAAGAGEAGMGFAVVAEEVRNLAQRSAQAAKDTAEMIETSIIRADRGADIVGKVAQSLIEIRDKAKKVNEIMNEITTASQEQAQGIFQINKAVNQMEQVTQSIASGAEESASSSEELSAQAEGLMEMVSSLIELVEGEKAAKNSKMKTTHRLDDRHERAYIPKPVKRIAPHKKESQEFSPETIIPLNEDTTDF